MTTLHAHDFEADVAPEFGGLLHRLVWRGHPLLHDFPSRDDWQAAPAIFGIPILFPPNRIEDGYFDFQRRCVRLPINEPEPRHNHLHGLALQAVWSTVAQTADAITLRLDYGPDSPEFADYPFPARLEMTYTLAPGRLTQTLAVTNLGDGDMPCALGCHTALVCPQRLRISSGSTCLDVPPPRHLPTGRTLDWHGDGADGAWFDPAPLRVSRHFRSVGAPLAELDYGAFRLTYRPDPQFTWWMLWKPSPECGFICPEPMNIPVNAHRNHLDTLPVTAAGHTTTFVSVFTLTEIPATVG